MALGLVQQVLLARILGAGGYGALSNVLSVSSVTYNPIVTASIQGVSHQIARAPEAERPAAVRRTVTLHLLLAVLLSLAFLIAAGPIATLLHAPHLTGALRVMSAVLLLYGLYAPLIGVLNGRRQFVLQAAFDVVAATLRTVGLALGAWWFLRRWGTGLEGASWGFAASALAITVAALGVVGLGRRGPGGPSWRHHLGYIVPVLTGQILLNLLLHADVNLLRAFAGRAASAAGLAPSAADPLVGAYRATQLYCFLPYQLLISVTFILFPLLSKAHHERDRQAVALYVRVGVRLAMLLAGAMVAVTSGLPGPLLRLVFNAEFARLGAEPMKLLTLGFGAFALFGIFTAVLNGIDRQRESARVTAAAVTLIATLCVLWFRDAPFGAELLERAALATSLGLALATLGAGWLVARHAGAVMAPLSALRILAAMAVTIAVARHLPEGGKLFTVAAAAAVGALYLVLLVVLRELTTADLASVTRIVGRRRGQPGAAP